MRAWCAVALSLATLWASIAPAFAARPLLDQHQWDAYFGLYARDTYVPWKTTTVRLDTYSGAPVDFAAFAVDPAEVIVAGQDRAPRALDTAHRRPVVRWRFSPPPGYRFETSDVAVPLGGREGFFVVEARRGDATQQVWVNRTRIGLVTQENPEGFVLWAADLRSGRALVGMHVDLLLGTRLVSARTDGDGLLVRGERDRPRFVLAEYGASRAFLSALPQAPAPAALVGVRLDSAVVRAGESVRFVGFARRRSGAGFRRTAGAVRVSIAGRGKVLATTMARLDAAGAFAGDLRVPAGAEAGAYAVLAAAAGAVGGTSMHVDAAGDVKLALSSNCPCDASADVALSVTATRDGAPADVPVRMQVVRSPHVSAPGVPEDALGWGTTVVYDHSLRTGLAGNARVVLPPPGDGLDSSYGVSATARGASATSRVVVPSGKVALALVTAPTAGVGAPIALDVRGFDAADGYPAAGLSVRLRLSHGASAQERIVTLDPHGRAQVVFRRTSLGSNLVVARASADGREVLDATSVLVQPTGLAGRFASADAVSVVTDRPRYRPGMRAAIRASTPGARGDALLALAGIRTYGLHRARVGGAGASATFDLGDPQGAIRAGAAFVRDGTIALGSSALEVEGPGRAMIVSLELDAPSYAPAATIRATLHSGAGATPGTNAIRIADGRESGAALFEDVPAILAAGATTTQASASDDPQWHAYVAPARSKASDIFAAERPRRAAAELPAIAAAAPRTAFWRVDRNAAPAFEVTAPNAPGHYVVSVLRVADDGDVGAASAAFDVR